MKVVIFGAGGQLGRDLIKFLEKGNNLFAFPREKLDITDFEKVKEVLVSLRPDVVINCAAWNNVDGAEAPENSFAVFKTNSFAPSFIAKISSEINSIFVNISTDYVFDGEKKSPYEETDEINPLSVYALSKALGEMLVMKNCKKYIIVRSGGLYGIGGSFVAGRKYRNFVEKVIENVSEGKKMKIVYDVFSAPTYTYELARKIVELLEIGFLGLIHIMQKGVISWFEFAKKICKILNLNDNLIEPISYDELNPPARRPKFSVLRNSILEKLGRNDMMEIEEALISYIRERKKYM